MNIEVLAFGQIAEIAGKSSWREKDISTTAELIDLLNQTHPALKNTTYKIAVNKKIINHDTVLSDNSVVALLPAFSGG